MIHILLNKSNFDQEWAYPSLSSYLTPDQSVCILSLAEEEYAENRGDVQFYYQEEEQSYKNLSKPFHHYHISDEQIHQIDMHHDHHDEIVAKINQADVLYLTGSNPEEMMHQIYDLNLLDVLKNYPGILMGDAIGSQIFMDFFPSVYEEEMMEGLGHLDGFFLESSYIEDEKHLKRMIRIIEDKGKAVFAYPEEGGIIIQDGHYELLGNAFICSEEDLDRIYQAYEDAKSRQDYYGDNGNW